jgi:uncharacterized protein
MNRSDLPLILCSQVVGGGSQQFPLDRIRMQKAVFLLSQRGSKAWRALYSYRPYNWGPYSSTLTADLERLVSGGALAVDPLPGSPYGSYATTPAGEHHARQVWYSLSDAEREFLRAVRSYVTSRSFNTLLREVYAAYPDFATASKFQE